MNKRRRSPFGSLLHTQMKTEYGFQGLSDKLGLGKHTRSAYLYLALMALALAPIEYMLFSFAKALSEQSVMIGQPGLPVVLSVTAGQGLVLFFGISGLMSTLYYSDDLELLQAMPFSAKQIMLAKVSVAYVAEMLTAAVVALPFFISLGTEIWFASHFYWLSALIVTVLIPAIPTAIGLLAVVAIMKLTGRSKRRDLFRVIFGLAAFALVMVFQYLNMNLTRYGPEHMMEMLMERNGLIQALAGYYPPLKWAAWGLTGNSIGQRLGGMGLFIWVSVAFLYGTIVVGQRFFFGGLSLSTSARETKARKKPEAVELRLDTKQRSPVLAMFWREHKLLTRTPNFFLVALTNLAIVPILLLVSSFSASTTGMGSLQSIKGMLPIEVLVLGAAAAHGLVIGMNQIASSSISREGPMFWFSKAVPLSPKRQVRGKLLYAMSYSAVQLVILLGAAQVLLGLGIENLAPIAVLGILVSWPVGIIGLLTDLAMPKLNWTNPQQAMKGNFGTLLASLFVALYIGALFLVTKLLYPGLLKGWALYGVMAALVGVSGRLLQASLDSVSGVRYTKIQV